MSEQDTSTPPRRRGVSTGFIKAQEARDERQDARTDRAWEAALQAAKDGQAAAERTTKYLYIIVALSLTANAVLTAMVLGVNLGVSKEGVQVGAGEAPAAKP